ncbi:MAG: zinc ribbon domain-containing protein [Thermoguttaceae bacterium]|jgi:putative FmdB family regulatory protein|nr:zinc ribbon domain-containing protein [Thermoguttaceae bacterium]
MPIYEYVCKTCGNAFEQLIRGAEKAQCPACGKRRLEKKFSVPAAHSQGAAEASACPYGACGMRNQCQGGACGLE